MDGIASTPESASRLPNLDPADLLFRNSDFKPQEINQMSAIFEDKDIDRAVEFVRKYLDKIHLGSSTQNIDKAMYVFYNLSAAFGDKENQIESYLYTELWKKIQKNNNVSVLVRGFLYTKFLFDRHHAGDYADLDDLYESLDVLIGELFAAINTLEGKYYIRVLASLLVNDALLDYFGKRMRNNKENIKELVNIMNNCREGMEQCNKMIYTHLLLFLIKNKDVAENIVNIGNIIESVKKMPGDEQTNICFDVICLEYAVIAHDYVDPQHIEELQQRVESQNDAEIKIDFYLIKGNYYKKLSEGKIISNGKVKDDVQNKLHLVMSGTGANEVDDYKQKAIKAYQRCSLLARAESNCVLNLGPNYKLLQLKNANTDDVEKTKRYFFEGWEVIKESFGQSYLKTYWGRKYFEFWKGSIVEKENPDKKVSDKEILSQIRREFDKYIRDKYPYNKEDIETVLMTRFPNIRFVIYDTRNSSTISGIGFEKLSFFPELLNRVRKIGSKSMSLGGSDREKLDCQLEDFSKGFFSMSTVFQKFTSADKHYIVIVDNGPKALKSLSKKELSWIEKVIKKKYGFNDINTTNTGYVIL